MGLNTRRISWWAVIQRLYFISLIYLGLSGFSSLSFISGLSCLTCLSCLSYLSCLSFLGLSHLSLWSLRLSISLYVVFGGSSSEHTGGPQFSMFCVFLSSSR